MKRVAFYARVSTHEGKQHAENQLRVMREYSHQMNWTAVAQYVDQQTGSKDATGRVELSRMLKDAARRRFDIVLVHDLSRLTREGPAQAFAYVERLRQSGVEFWSATEEHFRTAGIAGDLFVAIAAWIARESRKGMVNRVRAGLDRARAEGKKLGPPPKSIDVEQLRALRNSGLSYRKISSVTGEKRSTIVRRLADNTFSAGPSQIEPQQPAESKAEGETQRPWDTPCTRPTSPRPAASSRRQKSE